MSAELRIEAFWLGEDRFFEEMSSHGLIKMTELKASQLSPEESRFLSEGDRVWDLIEHYRKAGFELSDGWAVYNESSGYLVVKANVIDLWGIENRHGLETIPKLVEVRLKVFKVRGMLVGWVDWGENWKDTKAKKLFATTLSSRSGETASQLLEEVDLEVRFKIQPTIGYDDDSVDLRQALEFTVLGQNYSLNTGVSLRDGRPIYFELGHFAGGANLVATLRSEIRLPGGPPLQEAHLTELKLEGKRTSLPESGKYGDFSIPTGGVMQMVAWEVSRTFADDLFPNKEKPDPFATGPEEEEPSGLKVRSDVPAFLTRAFPKDTWFELTEVFRDSGVSLAEGEFALVSKLRNLLVVASADVVQFDIVDQITESLGPGLPRQFQLACTILEENAAGERKAIAKAVVPVRSGETATLVQTQEFQEWDVEVQPTEGRRDFVDLRYAISHKSNLDFQVTAGLTLRGRKPSEHLIRERDGQSIFLRLQAVEVDYAGKARE